MRAAALSLALLALASCAASPEQVAARCEREAASSTVGVSGEFQLGYASDRGFVNDSAVALSAGVNLGSPRDPRVVYEECVRARTGQGPVRPYGAS